MTHITKDKPSKVLSNPAVLGTSPAHPTMQEAMVLSKDMCNTISPR